MTPAAKPTVAPERQASSVQHDKELGACYVEVSNKYTLSEKIKISVRGEGLFPQCGMWPVLYVHCRSTASTEFPPRIFAQTGK